MDECSNLTVCAFASKKYFTNLTQIFSTGSPSSQGFTNRNSKNFITNFFFEKSSNFLPLPLNQAKFFVFELHDLYSFSCDRLRIPTYLPNLVSIGQVLLKLSCPNQIKFFKNLTFREFTNGLAKNTLYISTNVS
jgi:hypothetical protein